MTLHPQSTLCRPPETAVMFREFENYLHNDKFTDLLLYPSCGSKGLRCHSLVLAAASPIIASALGEIINDDSDCHVIIPDLPKSLLDQFLNLVYSPIPPQFVAAAPEMEEWLNLLGIVLPKDVTANVMLEDVEEEESAKGSLVPDLLGTSELGILTDPTLGLSPLLQPPDPSSEEDELLPSIKYRKAKASLQFCCDFVGVSSCCTKSFSTRQRLEMHKQQVHGVMRIPLTVADLTCDTCDSYTAKTTAALEVHKRNHTGLRPYSCDHCAKTFASETYLEQHLHSHNTRKIHQCPTCFKTFQSLPSLSQHKQTHESSGLWTCEQCQRNFRTRRYLYQHNRKKHQVQQSPQQHQCGVCSKVLAGREELVGHARTHTGERPFTCSVCATAFRFRSSLNTHLKSHSNDRRFSCQQCSKAFIKSSDLKKHLRTHNNDRPYSCEICAKAFARSDYLRKHMRTHSRGMLMMDIVVEEEDIAGNVNALLGDGIPSEAVELDSLGPTELVLDDTGHPSDWPQPSVQLVTWEKVEPKPKM